MTKNSILIVDDQPEILNALERLLKSTYRIFLAPNGKKAIEILKKQKISVILADQRMPVMTGVEFLQKSLAIQPHTVRILITAYADIQASVAAINKGQIYYYISKPWEPDELLIIIHRAVERFNLIQQNETLARQLKEANRRLKQENILLQQNIEKEYDFQNIIGHSPKMLEVFKLASKIMETPTTILLMGETGTGKELLARAIHYNGIRKDKMFVTQNCGALPDTLLESELFGHVKGAFTGAVSDKKGLFELANEGTVFLDEIGDTSPAMQQRLLRVLQEGEIKPVGSAKTVLVDVRIIAATNKNLDNEVKYGRFREDLYYRLHVFPITLPPLRERKEDIPDLVNNIVGKVSLKIKKTIPKINSKVLDIFTHYSFPGNIRELENEIERAVTLVEDHHSLTPDLLSPRFSQVKIVSATETNRKQKLKDQVETLEKKLIEGALTETHGNILQAAKKLGLSRAGLHKKLNRYKILVLKTTKSKKGS